MNISSQREETGLWSAEDRDSLDTSSSQVVLEILQEDAAEVIVDREESLEVGDAAGKVDSRWSPTKVGNMVKTFFTKQIGWVKSKFSSQPRQAPVKSEEEARREMETKRMAVLESVSKLVSRHAKVAKVTLLNVKDTTNKIFQRVWSEIELKYSMIKLRTLEYLDDMIYYCMCHTCPCVTNIRAAICLDEPLIIEYIAQCYKFNLITSPLTGSYLANVFLLVWAAITYDKSSFPDYFPKNLRRWIGLTN